MYYEKLKHQLCKELEEISEKGDINNGSLDAIDKLTHSIKSIDTIMAMENAGYSNYSRNAYDGGSYDSYDSFARGRSPMTGRYVSREGNDYSRRYSNMSSDQFMHDIESLMESAPDDNTRNQLRKMMADMRK